MAFHETSARARIKTVILTVDSVGDVYDYERYSKKWNTLRSLFTTTSGDVTRLRGWTITLASMEQEATTFGASDSTHVIYTYRIRGFEGVDDANATEKSFCALALAVITALDADTLLHSNTYEDGASGKFVSEPSPYASFDYRMFGGVLVHMVEITMKVEEII
jgi:hypothetical protein